MVRMNKKQKTITHNLTLWMSLIGVLFITQGIFAEVSVRGVLLEQRKDDIQEKIQEKKEVRENTKSILEQAKDIIKEKIKKQIKGQLVTISGNTLTVKKDEATYTVLVSDRTELKRKFGGSSTLNEFSPNDMLVIIGNRVKNDDRTLSPTGIEAIYIRNMSIQRRFAVFTGMVTSKTSNTLTLKTVGRGAQTVYVSSSTQYKEKNKEISLEDIQIGNKIVVKGELWNRTNEKIDAKTIVKLGSRIGIVPSVTKTRETE